MTGLSADLQVRLEPGARARVRAAGPMELRGPFAGRQSGRMATDGQDIQDEAGTVFDCYYLRNVTAGIFAGDSYRTSVSCAPGATARIESPSATKVYSMPDGAASTSVELHAEAGSRLVWGPHPTVLHTGAALAQQTRVTLHPAARVLIGESVAMGRIASGQRFDFARYAASLEVCDESGAVRYREAFDLVPGEGLEASMGGLPVLTCVYALGAFGEPEGEPLDEVCGAAPLAGWSALPDGCGLVVKALTASLSQGTAFARRCLELLEDARVPGEERVHQPAASA